MTGSRDLAQGGVQLRTSEGPIVNVFGSDETPVIATWWW